MTDDRRWLEASSEADDALRELLGSAERDDPSAAELESLTARLAPQLGGGPSLPPSAPAAGSTGAVAAAKIGVAIVVIGAAGWLALRSPERSARPLDRALDQLSLYAAAPPPPIPAPAAVASAAATSSAPTPSASAQAEREDELSLIQRAHAALRSGQAASALELTQEHAKTYPRGVLGQEREVIAVEALQRLGRYGEARSRGDAFLRVFPKSSHARRVRAILGLKDAGSKPAVPSAAFPVEEKSTPAHNPPAVSP
jgi:TolA-binding protein